jgi:RND superfamily putative drug exporter
MSVFVINISTMVGLGVGIDYSLLVVTRFREELNRGRSSRDAAIRTIRTAGNAVVTSGLTVLVGFSALLTTPLIETRSVGLGGLLVVSVAVLLATTLLPALLSVMGRNLDRPRWLANRLAWFHAPTGWERWARWLTHHPWHAIALGGGAIALLSAPLLKIQIGLPTSHWFPPSAESSQALEDLREIGAAGAVQPIRLVVTAADGQTAVSGRHLPALRALSDTLRADPRIRRVRSVVDVQPDVSLLAYTILYGNLEAARDRFGSFLDSYLSDDARTTLLEVELEDSTSLTGAMHVVRVTRGIAANALTPLDEAEILVGGFAASSVDLQDQLLSLFPRIIAMVLGVTALMLFIAFRSILVPVKAVLLNSLSVTATFGLTVLVFQYGVGGQLIGLDEATGAIFVVVPVLVFAIVFGLSMDYEVFLLSRIKESFDRTGRNDYATLEGLSATASVITSAAAIMIIVFGTFAFAEVLAAKFLGFGLAVAVFLDATIIRMVLVPAIMHVAGRWNWWPGVRGVPAEGSYDAPSKGGGPTRSR